MTAGFLISLPAVDDIETVAKGKKKTKQKKKKSGKNKGPQSPPASPPAQSPPPPPPPVAPPRLAYICAGPVDAPGDDPGTIRVAQTFTPGSIGLLRRIVFPTRKPPGSLGDFVVQLLAVDENDVPVHLPAGVLAEVIVPNDAVASGENVTLTAEFSGPPLVAGTRYAAVLSRPGPDTLYSFYLEGNHCFGRSLAADPGKPFETSHTEYELLVSVFVS